MAEVLVEFTDVVPGEGGTRYVARACGRPTADGTWEGWIEFLPVDDGPALRTGRETTQPNRTDTLYWATGLTAVYLEGALHRALHPLVLTPPREIAPPAFDGPAPEGVEGILNPFSVYRKGETLLRSQLNALSPWHLVNIIRAYGLSREDPSALNAMPSAALADVIVAAVRAQEQTPASK